MRITVNESGAILVNEETKTEQDVIDIIAELHRANETARKIQKNIKQNEVLRKEYINGGQHD